MVCVYNAPMAFLDQIDKRVYPEFQCPIVAQAAIVAMTKIGMIVPDNVSSIVLSVCAKQSHALSTSLGEVVKNYNDILPKLSPDKVKIISDMTALTIGGTIIDTTPGSRIDIAQRLASAVYIVGMEIGMK